MSFFWRKTNLEDHIIQHNTEAAAEHILTVPIGTKSANFQTFIMQPNAELVGTKIYLNIDTDLAASDSAYWTIVLAQLDQDGRTSSIVEFDGSKWGFLADIPFRVPAIGSLNAEIARKNPIFIVGTKTGSPANLTNLSLQLNWVLR